MKTLFFIFTLLTSLTIHSQIPDSLEVSLPWDIIYVTDCDAKIGVTPTTTNSNVVISTPTVTSLIDSYTGECYKNLLEYTILDWKSGLIYTFLNIVKVNDQFTLKCTSDITITYEELPNQTTASELIENSDPTHRYSFDPNNELDNTINFSETDIANGNYELFVYDHDDRSVCNINVYLTYCEEDIIIDVPEGTTIEFNQEPFIPLTLELLSIAIDYPCGAYTANLYHGNQSRKTIFPNSIGTQLELTLEIDFENGNDFTQTINLNVTGTPPSPIPMFIEEKEFQAGEVVEFDIWSADLKNLAAWGFRLNFENAAMTEITEGATFDNIPHNIFNDGKTINTIWTPLDALPIDMTANETWFTLTVIPEIDGNTFDIFSTTNDPWSSIVIEEGLFLLEYEADFVFNVAPRDILNGNSETKLTKIQLVQNPVSQVLKINGMKSLSSESIVSIRSIDGQLIRQLQANNKVDNLSIDITQLNAGLYFTTIRNRNESTTLKFVKE